MLTCCQDLQIESSKSVINIMYYLDMSTNELQVPDEFINQNSEYAKIKKPAKKGGPYSKNEKDVRRDEVYRLCFDYGYSARKIADLMKINRNTINGDIDYWYNQIFKNMNWKHPEASIVLYLERLEMQMTRLREQLDKVNSNSERISIEHLIYDINSKILNTYQKISQSIFRVNDLFTKRLNEHMKKNNETTRFLTYFDTISVSEKKYLKIKKIIEEDIKRGY